MRRTLLAVVVLGAAAALASATSGGAHDLVDLVSTVQSTISIIVPLSGIVLVAAARRPTAGDDRASSRLVAAAVVALACALAGVAICVVAVGLTGSGADRWHGLGQLAVGSVVVQLTAQLVGTGLGLLIRRRGLAFASTIVLPLGLWLLLGAVSPAAQSWLTPFASAQHQLSGAMTSLRWAQTVTVLLLWGLGLNLLGLARLHRSREARAS